MMKKLFSITFIISSIFASLQMSPVTGLCNASGNFTIDLNDTVVFDLSKSVINNNSVSFPVSILSDDTILSLDFSFKYNQLNLGYDSLVNLNNYMQTLAYYNINDSTFRFSSNSSVHPFVIDTPLVALYFDILSTQINPTDLDTPKVYLNGIKCSFKIIPPVLSLLNNENNYDENISVFPNPTVSKVTVTLPIQSHIQITNTQGMVLINEISNIEKGNFELNLDSLIEGIYYIKIWNNYFSTSKKLIIQNM